MTRMFFPRQYCQWLLCDVRDKKETKTINVPRASKSNRPNISRPSTCFGLVVVVVAMRLRGRCKVANG